MSANTATTVLLSGSLDAVSELGSTLRKLGYAVELHPRPAEAIQAWSRGHCALALLSISHPQRGQISAISAFRAQRPHAPIVIVSASTQIEDRVAALDAGADDYIIEPFAMPELRARLSAVVRNGAVRLPAEIRVGSLLLREGDPGLMIGSSRVDLTPRERALVEMFALAAGNIVAKSAIAQRLGKDGESVSRTAVELSVHRLRRRLKPFGLSIVTLRRVGYRLQLANIEAPTAVKGGEPRDADVPLAEAPLEAEPMWWNTRLLEYTNDAIIIWEMHGRGILYWNRAAELLYGYSRSVALGQTTHDLLRTQLAGGVTNLESSLAKYGVWIGELTHTTSSGRRVQVEGRLALMSQHNQRWLVLEVNRDITDRKALELSRQVMERQLEALRSLRSA